MKKVVSVILAAALILAMPCAGADLDYSSMSDSELQAVVDSARTELFQRKQREENGNLIICDADGVQVALTGNFKDSPGTMVRLEITIVNNSNLTVSTILDKGYINSWEVSSGMSGSGLLPGKKERGDLWFNLEGAGISSIDEIEDMSFIFRLFDSETYDDIYRSPEMQIFIDEGKVISVQEVFDIG